ncbi:DUF2164 domain-containing protein [Bacillus timonensis]|nr:DUF2164 domain-containing protein [Bacillus timonensis]
MDKKFFLSKEVKEEMIRSIQNYFLQEKDEELGDLAATLMLDFFMKDLAPHFYNQGVSDAHRFFSEKLDDVFEIQK